MDKAPLEQVTEEFDGLLQNDARAKFSGWSELQGCPSPFNLYGRDPMYTDNDQKVLHQTTISVPYLHYLNSLQGTKLSMVRILPSPYMPIWVVY